VNRPEAITQQVLRIESLDFFKLFWEMALWRVIAENMLDCDPYPLRAEKDAALEMMKIVQVLVRIGFFGENLPDVTGSD
jgi:hypothetical protein